MKLCRSLLPLSLIAVVCSSWRFSHVEAFTSFGERSIPRALHSSERLLRGYVNEYAPAKLYAQKEGESVDQSNTKKRVVIVGGGIAGVTSAYDARHILDDKSTEVVVVSDKPDFSFVPSNPWIAIRKRKPCDVQLPLADILPRHGIEFVHDKAVRLDPATNRLVLASGTKLAYDYLIIATGPRLAFDRVPGLDKVGVSVCTTSHAMHAADVIDKVCLG